MIWYFAHGSLLVLAILSVVYGYPRVMLARDTFLAAPEAGGAEVQGRKATHGLGSCLILAGAAVIAILGLISDITTFRGLGTPSSLAFGSTLFLSMGWFWFPDAPKKE